MNVEAPAVAVRENSNFYPSRIAYAANIALSTAFTTASSKPQIVVPSGSLAEPDPTGILTWFRPQAGKITTLQFFGTGVAGKQGAFRLFGYRVAKLTRLASAYGSAIEQYIPRLLIDGDFTLGAMTGSSDANALIPSAMSYAKLITINNDLTLSPPGAHTIPTAAVGAVENTPAELLFDNSGCSLFGLEMRLGAFSSSATNPATDINALIGCL